jgi:hypothetical protein
MNTIGLPSTHTTSCVAALPFRECGRSWTVLCQQDDAQELLHSIGSVNGLSAIGIDGRTCANRDAVALTNTAGAWGSEITDENHGPCYKW